MASPFCCDWPARPLRSPCWPVTSLLMPSSPFLQHASWIWSAEGTHAVPPAGQGDVSVGAAISYALEHLEIDDIVVCGHTGCGGIQALLAPIPPGREAHLGRWVDYTRPAHKLMAAAGDTGEDRLTATVKAHVQFQLDNLMTYDIVRQGFVAGKINVHGWVYDMESGEILAYDPEDGAWRGLVEAHGG